MRKIAMMGLVLLLLLSLVDSAALAALKPEYRRNGECYLLIGEGPTWMRGIYRLNNPEKDKYYDPPKYLFKPMSSIGFSVDLDRKIYTFSEKVVPGYVWLNDPLPRQVLNSGSTDLADYGYHQYIHYDHRSWGKNTAVYRTGPKGRNIRAYSGSWPYFKSAGPGTPIPTPSGNPLPDVPSIPLGVYSGKAWYSIPNGAWFSSWRTKPCQSGRPGPAGYFYVVYGDRIEGQPHNWTLYTYNPDNVAADAPNYSYSAGQVVAVSYDKKITRQIFAGCLDGCGGASGSGGGVADPMITDLAFMPPIKSQPSRTYFYSRPENDTNYTVTRNKAKYAPPSPPGNPIIGSPARKDTYWIGVSMRNVSSDYVYCVSNHDIQQWYKQATNSNGNGIQTSAVTVSNQWNQKGGIVFALDKKGKMVYKFTRYENDPYEPPITKTRYEGIDISDLMSLIEADKNAEIDDIKADGFGSLFFAMTYPSKSFTSYDPRNYFKLNETIRVYPDPSQDPSEPERSVWLIYCQKYGKAVFERNIRSSTPREIGRKTFAERYYNLNVRISPEGLNELVNSAPFPNDYVEPILASWSAKIGNNDGVLDKNDFSYGSKGLYTDYNYTDPGYAKLAVINVPSPPEVISLGGKNSYLDICGPYSDIPVSTDVNSTQQNQYLISPKPAKLSLDKLYYFMVENYPLTSGAWNPKDQPDWDGDGRQGGFITSIDDTNSSTNGGSVAYRWRTWMVEDMFGKPVYPPEPYPLTPSPRNGSNTGQEHFNFFYSPVAGKFILTCQVIYDWYDFDLLNFGDTIDDLPKIYRANTKALPVAAGGVAMQTASSQLNSIMSQSDFKFMSASATQYINYITEKVESGAADNYYAVYPIVCGDKVATDPVPPELIAKIERCDGWAPNNVKTPTHWYAYSTYHGLEAGKPYFWRINLASQTVFFDDISKPGSSKNFIVDKMQNPRYEDGVQVNGLWVNHRPKVKFDNKGDDLRWLDNDIRLEAYLEYQIPDDKGLPKTVKLPLLASSSKAIATNKPIIASTPIDLPPTDPFYAEMVIKMSRTISYDMWVKNKDGVDLFPVRNLPLQFTVFGKTKVMIIDRQSPKILYAFTKPVNLFGDAGFPLIQGQGPAGGNPASITFRISDNNPWEAVDDVVGITDSATWLSNFNHNKGAPSTAPSAKFNYKPVFAKTLNRRVSLSYDRACRLSSGIVKLFPPNSAAPINATQNKNFNNSFGEMYVHKYSLSGGKGAPVENKLQLDFQRTKETVGSTDLHFATIGFRLPLNFVTVNSLDAGKTNLPKGYANNTPGYEEGGAIKPYKFYLKVTDSSGNLLNDRQLNLVLHPRDVHKPEPYGYLTEFKENTTTFFPMRENVCGTPDVTSKASQDWKNSPQNTSGSMLDESFFDGNDWVPDKTGLIKRKDANGIQTPYFRSLPQLKADIVLDYSSDAAYAYYVGLVDNKLPPAYLEDNVEFAIGCGVSDNAGLATATLTFKYLDSSDAVQTRQISSGWKSVMKDASSSGADPVVASTTAVAQGLFRGLPENFPMSVPVTIIAEDNAREWDYYPGAGGKLSDPNNPWSDWKWDPYVRGAESKNSRTFKTSIPVLGTNLIIRTIDKGLRNK